MPTMERPDPGGVRLDDAERIGELMVKISDEPKVIAKKPLSRIDITNSDRVRLELEVHSGSLRDASPPGKNPRRPLGRHPTITRCPTILKA